MAGLSITAVWDDTLSYVSRERALLLPMGLATFGLGLLIIALTMPQHPPGTPVPGGPWMIWMVPAFLLILIGNLAISRIALRPGTSVAEAFRESVGMVPRALGAGTVVIAVVMGLSVIVAIVVTVAAKLLMLDPRNAYGLMVIAVVPPLIWIGVKLIVLWPVIADRDAGVRETLSRAITLTQGHGFRIAGLLILNFLLYGILDAVIQVAGGAVLLLVTRLAGVPDLGPILLAILTAGFGAAYLTLWTVLLTRLYCQLGGSSRGI